MLLYSLYGHMYEMARAFAEGGDAHECKHLSLPIWSLTMVSHAGA